MNPDRQRKRKRGDANARIFGAGKRRCRSFRSLATTMTMAMTLVVGFVAAVTSSCATVPSGPSTVVLRVASNVSDATVWVDDHLVATVSDFNKGEKRLPVGFHRIEVRAPGYYSHFEELDVRPDNPITLQASLHQLLD